MPGLTTGAQQISTWATGDIIVYAAALGFVIAGFLCYRMGAGVAAFVAVLLGTGIASAGTGIARSVYGWFHTAALDVPHVGPSVAYAAATASSLFT